MQAHTLPRRRHLRRWSKIALKRLFSTRCAFLGVSACLHTSTAPLRVPLANWKPGSRTASHSVPRLLQKRVFFTSTHALWLECLSPSLEMGHWHRHSTEARGGAWNTGMVVEMLWLNCYGHLAHRGHHAATVPPVHCNHTPHVTGQGCAKRLPVNESFTETSACIAPRNRGASMPHLQVSLQKGNPSACTVGPCTPACQPSRRSTLRQNPFIKAP